MSITNLAAILQAQGKYAEAEPLYQRALDIYEKAQCKDPLTLATSLENYAALLRRLNREDEANRLETRARQIRETLKSKSHQ